MHNVIYLLLRRMRLPLIALIVTYAASVLGLVLIPGMDDQGRPWHMDFFHAFYFVSFMGSTIGFGEIPYPFTDAQRMWTLVTIYATVVAWLYAIGSLLSTLQDPAYRRVVRQSSFARGVRRIADPFYIVCGYGDTGTQVVASLAERGRRCVVIDIDQARVDALELEDLGMHVPGLCADAGDSDALLEAGLARANCIGVIALTNVDQVNLTIAITCRLLAPGIRTIARSEHHESEANMESFGTDHVVNPFDTFADRFAMAIHSPAMYRIYEWMTSIHPGERTAPGAAPEPRERIAPPRGTWVICGFGRFGKALQRYLNFEGLRTVIIEADPQTTEAPPETVAGRGTEAVTLRAAKVEEAVGIVAGTDDDANNLSIVITARELQPKLFTVGRQNQRRNDAMFTAAELDLIMQPGEIMARRILGLITNPLLADFLRHARHRDDAWAEALVAKIGRLTASTVPAIWSLRVDALEAAGLHLELRRGTAVDVATLSRDPRRREQFLPAIALLLRRADGEEILLPDGNVRLEPDDQLLFCGVSGSASQMRWTAQNHNVLEYVRTGSERPSGWIWRWLARS